MSRSVSQTSTSPGKAHLRRALREAAELLRADDPVDAFGRCFSLSLEMARVALARGVEADLVLWSVVGDADFLDHWAVAISDTEVIDLTRVQVDGRRGVLFSIDDYPANFVRRRRYPVAVFLPALGDGSSRGGQFNAAFVWAARRQMVRYDFRLAVELGRPDIAGKSVLSLLKFCLVQGTRQLHMALQARREALLTRVGSSTATIHGDP